MRKIMEISNSRCTLKAYHDPGKLNPYKVYRVYYDRGWHKRKLNEYADFNSILCFIKEYMWEK